MYLYRTKLGIKLIDYIGTKYKKTITVFSVLSIISGYVLMVAMIAFLVIIVKAYIFNPNFVKAVKVAPLMPLIPYIDTIFKVSFLPPLYFTYWIIAIAVIAIFHEFAHGIVAKRYGVQIKSTGFGFLGPFLAAFVEPNEKQMEKKTKFQQMAVLSSGTFTNLILAIIFFLLLALFFIVSYAPSGAIIGSYIAEPVKISSITSMGGIAMSNVTKLDIAYTIDNKLLDSDLTIDYNGSLVNVTRIVAGNKTYYMNSAILKNQLNQTEEQVILFPAYPAIMSGIRHGEVIKEINGKKVSSYLDLATILNNSKPGEKIIVKTEYNKVPKEYKITLAESIYSPGDGVIGVSFSGPVPRTTILGKFMSSFDFFKKPSTYYEPKYNEELILFIYNLLWWLALINISVALMNMLPVGLFDGGRMFMLTVWAVTRSKKAGELAFKIATYIILAAFAILMISWIIFR